MKNVALLEAATIPEPVLEVLRGLTAAGYRAFLVGGCVRDMLRQVAPKDFDVATSATPAQVQKAFRKVIPTGIEHGTVTVVVRGVHVEVTTFRTEGDYVDGRRPSSVEFHTDIDADLSRRDFTINAMAFDPVKKELVDPFDGQVDLAAKVIRCVRSAVDRFSEDGLRAMRAVRFATVLDFALEPQTEAAIAPTVAVFRKVAMERIQQELSKLLLSPQVTNGLELLKRTTLLEAFLPEASTADFAAVGRAPADLVTRLAVLLAAVPTTRDVLMRLKFSTREAELAAHFVKHQTLPAADSTDGALRKWLASVGLDALEGVLALNRALGSTSPVIDRLAAIAATNPPLTAKQLALDGKAIMTALGIGPSPAIGKATRHLLERVLEAPELNDPEHLKAILSTWKEP